MKGNGKPNEHKSRDNFGTGLKRCFDSCKCINCRKKKVDKNKNKD